MTEFTGVIAAVFALYFLFMALIGYYASRLTRSPADFFLANRALKAWVTAISSTASSESAWAVLGAVGMAYKDGLSAMWFMPGCLLGYAINWLFLAERLRKHSRETRAITIPDYLESHFHDKTHTLRVLSATVIFVCMMGYVASQFTAVGKTFDALFGIPYAVSIPVGGAVILLYTAMGGFRAVAWTDFVQGLIMVAGLVILAVAAVAELGGLSEAARRVHAAAPETLTWTGNKTAAAFLGSLVGLLGIGLGYPGQPHVITRYMAARDTRAIEQGTWIAIGWGFLIYSSAIVLGICGRALMPGLQDPESLFPLAAEKYLPPAVAAVVLTGILAAIMSTVSSQIIVAASAVAHDIYCKALRREPSHARIILISRATILALGIGAMIVALTEVRAIFWFVLFAWSGLGASFGPPILFTLYARNVTKEGAVAGIIAGFAVTVAWKVGGLSETVIYELVPAFLLSSLAVWLVSKWTAEKAED
ncbi:MAG: sodium/proline symporter [Nitrospinae bacterium]|nr:sodium/proline symporter [Nitrospinota bacterium]